MRYDKNPNTELLKKKKKKNMKFLQHNSGAYTQVPHNTHHEPTRQRILNTMHHPQYRKTNSFSFFNCR